MKTQRVDRNRKFTQQYFSPVVNAGACCLQSAYDSRETTIGILYSIVVFVFALLIK
jgi:hypothetical protein